MTFQLAHRRLVENCRLQKQIAAVGVPRTVHYCVDTSYSMVGRRTIGQSIGVWYFACGLRGRSRSVFDQLFCSDQDPDLRDAGRQVDALADFLRMSFRGGTDVTLALTEGLRSWKKAAIRMLTFWWSRTSSCFNGSSCIGSHSGHRHNRVRVFMRSRFKICQSRAHGMLDSAWFSDRASGGDRKN